MPVVAIYNRNHRTAWGRGLTALRLCFFGGDEVGGGEGSQRAGLEGVSSLSVVLKSRTVLCLCWLHTSFSGAFIRAKPLANTDQPTGSNPFRWRTISLTKSTTWDPGIGLFSYISSPLSFQSNTSRFFWVHLSWLLILPLWDRFFWGEFLCRFVTLLWFGGFCRFRGC